MEDERLKSQLILRLKQLGKDDGNLESLSLEELDEMILYYNLFETKQKQK